MVEILMICSRCDAEVTVSMDGSVLRVDVVPQATGELLYCCPACGLPSVSVVYSDLLAKLLLVGIRPLAVGEPRLEQCDVPPAGPPFTPDDLLSWHEQLDATHTVTPWE